MPDAATLQFAEELGLLWETSGAPRMAGRVLGWLLVCDPAEQTAAELAHALSASKGSISTTTRSLIAVGLIEKVAIPGQRSARLRITPGAWSRVLHAKVAAMTRFREMAERGLDALPADDAERRARLQEMHDTYAFFEREYPKLLDQYDEWRAAREDA